MVRAANELSLGTKVFIALWIVVCVYLVHLDLGVIAFSFSILFAIYFFGLRDKFSNEQTASAYSIFNKDGKGIAGGFSSNQLERQLRGHANHDEATSGDIAEARIQGEHQENVSEKQRLQRRKAAALAAERRSLQENKK